MGESRSEEPASLPSGVHDVGAAAWGVAAGDQVWVTNPATATVVGLDDDGTVVVELPSGAADPRDAGLALADAQLWVANLGGTVGVIDVATRQPIARVDVSPGEPAAVAVSDCYAWVPLHGPGGGLAQIDAVRFEVVRRIELPESAFDVAVADDAVWVAGLERRVFEIDATSGEIRRTIEVGTAPRGIALTDDSVWVTLRDDQEVARLDRRSGDIPARIPLDGQPWPIAAGDDVWVADLTGAVTRIDARTNEVTGGSTADPQPRAIAVAGGVVWVASQTGRVARIATG